MAMSPGADRLDQRPVVAVWRSSWLARSETFVRAQVEALTRWSPLTVGLRRLPDGLPFQPDFAPFTRSLSSRVAFKVSELSSHRFVFDRYLRDHDVRLIHAHFGPGGIKVLPVAARLRIPLVVTFHGFDATRQPGLPGPEGERYRAGLRRLFGQADGLIAVSEFIAGRLRGLGAPAAKVRVEPIGIPLPAEPAGLPPVERAGVTFVGRLIEQKGVHHLLDAYAQLSPELQARHPLRIVGTGALAGVLRERIETERLNAELLGYRTPAKVAELLAATSVFCAPSIAFDGAEEAFGIVYLEAAAAGCPVVAYVSGGVPESVLNGHTGLLAPEGDRPALGAALRRLLQEPSLAADFGRAGQARVRTQFDVHVRTSALERFYDEVVAGHSSR